MLNSESHSSHTLEVMTVLTIFGAAKHAVADHSVPSAFMASLHVAAFPTEKWIHCYDDLMT